MLFLAAFFSILVVSISVCSIVRGSTSVIWWFLFCVIMASCLVSRKTICRQRHKGAIRPMKSVTDNPHGCDIEADEPAEQSGSAGVHCVHKAGFHCFARIDELLLRLVVAWKCRPQWPGITLFRAAPVRGVQHF